MLYKEYISINSLFLHRVGNKLNQDELILSKYPVDIGESLKKSLLEYFFSSFKPEELYRLHHDIELPLNEVYTCASKIFANPDLLYTESVNLAKHLYNQSIHPKIKDGEFYVVYFKNSILDGETIDALGLFKSENKETFIEIEQLNDGFDIESRQGINIKKIDKGCLIFNTEKDNGYILSIIDNTNRGSEAQYWRDNFLNVQPKRNEYHQTNQFLGLTKSFVTNELSSENKISKADKIDLLNRSVEYFKNNDTFDKSDFEQKVFKDSSLVESFREFDKTYSKENEIEPLNSFDISSEAVKRQARVFKKVLKLDKNFHIYIHGNKDLIEKGVDEKGRKFYKIYYEEEN